MNDRWILVLAALLVIAGLLVMGTFGADQDKLDEHFNFDGRRTTTTQAMTITATTPTSQHG